MADFWTAASEGLPIGYKLGLLAQQRQEEAQRYAQEQLQRTSEMKLKFVQDLAGKGFHKEADRFSKENYSFIDQVCRFSLRSYIRQKS